MYQRSYAMGAEAKGKGVHVLLSPSIGPLGRQPAGGRNWEGFGSDPYLQGVGGYESVKGLQDAGTQACVKHWVANEQEHYRGDGGISNTISANVDDRTMHEVYMWPFAEAVKAGVASVMCAYNQVSTPPSTTKPVEAYTVLRSTALTPVKTASFSMVS
jgi:beta-glucosidase-like glycosyl hydrolase